MNSRFKFNKFYTKVFIFSIVKELGLKSVKKMSKLSLTCLVVKADLLPCSDWKSTVRIFRSGDVG